MKKVLRLLTILSVMFFCTFGMTSCSEKLRALHDLEELAEEVQEHGNSYGISEWREVFHQYQAINAVIDRHYTDYNQKQRNRIMAARSDIKRAAWDSIQSGMELFPGLKEGIMNLFQSVFGASGGDDNQ